VSAAGVERRKSRKEEKAPAREEPTTGEETGSTLSAPQAPPSQAGAVEGDNHAKTIEESLGEVPRAPSVNQDGTESVEAPPARDVASPQGKGLFGRFTENFVGKK
jgi:hypothetical protein